MPRSPRRRPHLTAGPVAGGGAAGAARGTFPPQDGGSSPRSRRRWLLDAVQRGGGGAMSLPEPASECYHPPLSVTAGRCAAPAGPGKSGGRAEAATRSPAAMPYSLLHPSRTSRRRLPRPVPRRRAAPVPSWGNVLSPKSVPPHPFGHASAALPGYRETLCRRRRLPARTLRRHLAAARSESPPRWPRHARAGGLLHYAMPMQRACRPRRPTAPAGAAL